LLMVSRGAKRIFNGFRLVPYWFSLSYCLFFVDGFEGRKAYFQWLQACPLLVFFVLLSFF